MPVCGVPDNLHVGCEYDEPQTDLRGLLQSASAGNFDFVVIPLCQRQTIESVSAASRAGGAYEMQPAMASDLALDGKTWSTSVVGMLSEWIDPELAPTDSVRRGWCLRALETELHWALHLGVHGVVLPPPSTLRCERYAAALGRLLLGVCNGTSASTTHTQLMLRVPMLAETPSGVRQDGWEVWNTFRLLCDQNTKLQVALELTPNLPATDRELERWFAEPVRAVIVPTDIFLTNKHGFPVLSKRHKNFLLEVFRYKVQVILKGLSRGGEGDAESSKYIQYIARLFQSRPPLTKQEQSDLPYYDHLQAPLQPLQDNLESSMYEIFEKDPVKYARYEDAICCCLQDKLRAGKRELTAMVVGAGRGPLVVAVRKAAERAGAEVRVWAVEKNPNAVITLRHRRQLEGWSNVEVVGEDMRVWNAPRPADLLVSELLGSFGDNELSPECLDGAQRFLARDGVSIPCRYTSYLTPVSCQKLWNEVRNYDDVAHFETAYVVRFHQAFYPAKSRETLPCFTFSHPNWELESNDRHAEIDFEIEVDSLIHGFAGYFHTDLYGDLNLSINPETYSDGMDSWFPIYFPLKTPLAVRRGQQLKSHWWRCQNSERVWYEWAVSEPSASPVHNPGGRSYHLGKGK